MEVFAIFYALVVTAVMLLIATDLHRSLPKIDAIYDAIEARHQENVQRICRGESPLSYEDLR